MLGEIEVRVDGQPVDIGHVRQRCVLVTLLLEANRSVSVGQLVDRVWGDRRRPDRPTNTLQTYVSLLRRALSPIEEVSIARQSAGYRLTVDEQTVDVQQFRQLVRAADTAAGDSRYAALERALGLWRGDAFANLDTPWINAMSDTLENERYAARLDLTDIQLNLGQHATLLATLHDRTVAHPLDERVAGQFMLGLYRSGRQADALAHYQQIRRRLAEELGVDPSPPLQRLHRQILSAEPALIAPVAATPGPTRPVVPRQLPAPPRLFTGRLPDLTALTQNLDVRSGAGAAVVVSAIGGIGGIGKSWLALHWAYQHLDRFPDGQLHVNLRGFDPTGQPTLPTNALRGILDALGVAPAAIPLELDAQVGLYRSLVTDKHMLIVLDNAANAAQVVPLLPGSPTCVVLVTSRDRLTGLVTGYGARTLDLGGLDEAEARELLARHLGYERLAAEPHAVTELLACCAGLPLAISIVAARANAHPEFPLAVLADELGDQSSRLDGLGSGDAGLRAVLSWSVYALSPRAAAVFGLLGLANGPDISLPAVASLTALPLADVRVVLRELEHAYLVQQPAPGRYRMHDLVRLFAVSQAHHDLPETVHTATVRRLVDFYLHTAHGAQRLLQPLLPLIELDAPAIGCQPHPLDDQTTALAWFTAEDSNLLASQHLAAARGWADDVWRMAWILTTFLYRQGRFRAALATWQAAQTAAGQLDPAAQTSVHQLLGQHLRGTGAT